MKSKKCIECKKEFFKNGTHSNKYWKTRKFCDRKCSSKSRIGQKPWNYKKYSVIPKKINKCNRCNKKFFRKKEAMVKFVNKKYCGNECMLESLHEGNIGNKYASRKQSKKRRDNTSKIMKSKFRNGEIKPSFRMKSYEYKGMKFRSSWEVSFAKECDKNNKKWEYENHKFHIKSLNTTYIPDFYLPEEDKFIEIKGYWYPHSKKKFDAFRKEYPKINIEVKGKVT